MWCHCRVCVGCGGFLNILYCYTNDTKLRFSEAYNSVIRFKEKYDIKFEMTDLIADPYSLWKVVNRYWGQDDLILIMRSIVVSESLIRELIDCPKPLCTHYTTCSKMYGGIGKLTIGNRVAEPIYETLLFVDDKIPEYVSFTGLGFAKISHEFQRFALDKFGPQFIGGDEHVNINLDNAIITNINKNYSFDDTTSETSPVDGNRKALYHVHKLVEHLRSYDTNIF